MLNDLLQKGNSDMKRISLFLCVLMLFACGRSSEGQGDKSTQKGSEGSSQNSVTGQAVAGITCWGVGEIEFGDDMGSVTEKAGKDNVSIDSLFQEGDFARMITVLWKGKDKQLDIAWEEEKPPFTKIKYITISNPKSPYAFDNGIKIGTSLNEIVKLNNGDIKLYGFGWDYGGSFISFGNGRLAGDLPCFGGVFQLEENTESEGAPELFGDREISSSNPEFKNHKVILTEIIVSSSD